MSLPRNWLTPDSIADSTRCYRLSIPDDEESLAIVTGALLLLADESNWEKVGTMTPAEAAEAFGVMIEDFLQRRQCMVPGTIFFYAGATDPDGALLCDGSEVAKVIYPDLFDAIGNSYGNPVSGDNFVLPDFRDMFLIASGSTYAQHASGGETDHTLTSGEMPAHTHSEVIPTVVPVVCGPGAIPVSQVTATPTVTGSAGGGGSHNNMPPYYSVPVYIAY